MLHEFCTYFDRNFISQGLALCRSLERHTPNARIWVLCLDDYTRRVMQKLDVRNVELLTVDDLLDATPALRPALDDRSLLQFYYACTPRLPEYVLNRAAGAPGVTYLDADMYFFDSAEAIFAESPEADVQIVEHASGDLENEGENGKFNVCIVDFKDSASARSCLSWWAERTLESTALNNEVYGDQKYLDEFPTRFSGVHVLQNPGVTLAPWNLWRHRVESLDEQLLVDGRPLVVFHFARFLPLHAHVFMPIRRLWISRRDLELVYRPYMRAVRQAFLDIRRVDSSYRIGYTARNVRALLLGAVSGRVFYEGPRGLLRLGVYVPSGRSEMNSWHRGRKKTRS